ncbi:hypothetical protein PCC7418_3566 [Halothece sp. PCC 7418]|uniref:Pycsar system effector family protein n=1 Tax=Halothece sp. (strain PCC 7418) TaxID=65093 RepID=UPI0002A06DC3|nr:Pycsar system effector family protein [Halothece sp. PCC 7418]AFZ45676.1 hypothetical protein PCC7418_3566 [Halothece sp. PCC 7418]
MPEQEVNDARENDLKLSKHDDHDVIYTIRTVCQNQTQLIMLADQKANILIGIISVVFTIFFTRVHFITGLNQWLTIPLAGFVIVETVAAFLALLVIFPRQTKRPKTQSVEELANPLFFGNFSQFKRQDIVDFLVENMDDNYSARSILITDLYQAGMVLKDKYTLLRYAYLCTIFGVVLMALTLLISLFV